MLPPDKVAKQSFLNEVTAAMQARAKARAASAQQKPSRPRRSNALSQEYRPIEANTYSEEEAQSFLPERFRLFKDTLNNRFRVRHPLFGCKSRSWPTMGEPGALARIIRWSWRMHAKETGQATIPLPPSAAWAEAFPDDIP